MEHYLRSFFVLNAERFQQASSTDFGILALTVVILGWYASRYLSD